MGVTPKKWCWSNVNTLARKCHPGNFTQGNDAMVALRSILLNSEIHSNNVLFQIDLNGGQCSSSYTRSVRRGDPVLPGIPVWKWFKIILNNTSAPATSDTRAHLVNGEPMTSRYTAPPSPTGEGRK